MTARVVELGDALVDLLEAMTWSGEAYEVNRIYDDGDELLADDDAGRIHVDVVMPEDYASYEQDTNESVAIRVPYAIVIRKKFGAVDQKPQDGMVDRDEMDAMVELVESLADSPAFETTQTNFASWVETQVDQLYRRDHLRQHRQFTGVVSVTFEIHAQP